jgi:hypothetical protein
MEIPYANFYPESLTIFFEFRQVSWLAFVLVNLPIQIHDYSNSGNIKDTKTQKLQ